MRKRSAIKENHLPSVLSLYPTSLLALVFCLFSLLFTYFSYHSLKQSQDANEQRYQAYLLATQLHQRSDQLTLMARSYAVTGEQKYFEFYNEILDIRRGKPSRPQFYHRVYWDMLMPENGLSPFPVGEKRSFKQLMSALNLFQEEVDLLFKAKNISNQLSRVELQAFSEVKSGLNSGADYASSTQRSHAISLLYHDDYLLKKTLTKRYINQFFDLQEPRSSKELALITTRYYLFATLTTLSFLLLIFFLLYNLYKQSKNKVLFVKALRKEVSNRTLELFEKREQLKVVIHEMEMTKSQLVESEKMASLGNLVSGVAHEVNTPLGISVTLGSHLHEETKLLLANVESGVLKRSDLDRYCSETLENCTLLLANLDRAANLISSFKQVAVDQSSDEVRSFKVSEYIDEVLLSLHPRIKKTAIKITVNVPPDEPFLTTYPGAIAQIVTNLVMNSLIHAFNNSQDAGNINFQLSIKDNEMLIEVSDDGKGMPFDVAEKIFEPFFTTQRGHGGSGLGLSIVYNLVVHQLKGRIKCKSILQEGTTFFIRFPMQTSSDK
ncbi:sensor histidine kinase [Psychromonas hadalis]|uniref:sensor histidine kinase n=1 Tax=Psychromonas hadalis TaxID=211669 RepID=UPI0003B3474C|nr:HAMP domain-containing sensor histidine kinase [Psychromonas hadalis]